MNSAVERLMESIQCRPSISVDQSGVYSHPAICDDVEQRRQEFLAQGLGAGDCISLSVDRDYIDWVNLLAALSIGSSILLVSERVITKPEWISIELIKRVSGQLRRHASASLSQNLEDPMVGILSSGSTGDPKTIWHHLSHFMISADASNDILPLMTDDVSLVSLPLFHVGGLGIVFRAALSGSGLLFGPKADDLPALTAGKVTRLSLVPTQLFRLLQQGKAPMNTSVLLGGAPISTSLWKDAKKAGWQLHRSYGLSEMASQVITEVSENTWRILPHAQLRAQENELVVAGKSLFLGYGSPSQKWESQIIKEFSTGDLAKLDLPSFEFIGRQDNLFICGGENVQPEPIEKCFLHEFNLNEVFIVPLDDPEWGARPVLLVDRAAPVMRESMKQFAQTNLLPYEKPVEYFYLPEKQGMKYSRKTLKEQVNENALEAIN